MGEFTKGPWVASGFEVFDERNRDPVADCCYSDYDTNRANARLVAAAPDLLEALEDLESYVTNNLESNYPTGVDVNSVQFQKACAAIARARGEA